MISNIEFDIDTMEDNFSRNKHNISEMIKLRNIVIRKNSVLESDLNNCKIKTETVIKKLEQNMFNQEMKVMAIILTRSYGKYSDETEYYGRYMSHHVEITKEEGKNLCLISSQGLHLTLSSLKE
jgi:hypothetical protein